MLNLIYVGNYRPQIGGAAISCAQLLEQFTRRGCRTRILASVTRQAALETSAYDMSKTELGIRRFLVPKYFNDPNEPPPSDWEEATREGVHQGLQRMIEESRPDLLLVREGWIPYSNEVARRHAIPTVAMVRGNPTAAILRGVFPNDRAAAFLAELRKVESIVTVANHFLPGLKQFGVENAQCVRNGVDTESFSRRPRDPGLAALLAINDSDIVALHAGGLRPLKRPLDIVRSAAQVLKRNSRVLYLFVGDGVSREEIASLALQFGIADRFRLQGYVDYSLMPAYINLADIILMPSESEGLSRVYLECQACAKTLVASDIPAAREMVTHGETGLLFRKGDVDDLVAKTLLAADSPQLRVDIGNRALKYVQRHSIGSVVEDYLQVLEGVHRTMKMKKCRL